MLNSFGPITQHISEADIKTYFVGFDYGEFRYEALTDVLLDTIVDFAFGYHSGILKTYDRRKLIEAAKSIYKIKEYSDVKWVYIDEDACLYDDDDKIAQNKTLKRGEFGELVLHLILRDHIKTIPLLSKIHFKDTDGVPVHGFDCVHIGPDVSAIENHSLYFGESKIYSRKDGSAGQSGIDDLINDIKNHFKLDFLKREIAFICKKKYAFVPLEEYADENTKSEYESFLASKKHWFNVLERAEKGEIKLQDFLKSVTVPLLCTYESRLFENHKDENDAQFLLEYEKEVRKLKTVFDTKLQNIKVDNGQPITTDLNVILLLFPIPSKKELIKKLHLKLYNQQNA
jgi:hypothetical protein